MKKKTNKIEDGIKTEIENALNLSTFDESLLEMEEERLQSNIDEQTLLELEEVMRIISLVSTILLEEVDIMEEATLFAWYCRKGWLEFDVITREFKFVDWSLDTKTTLALEGVASRFNLTHDFYMSESERKKLDTKLNKGNKENN